MSWRTLAISIILFTMFVIPVVESGSISLGHVIEKTHLDMEDGQRGEFKLTFFNTANNAFDLKLEIVESPEWLIEVIPNRIRLPPLGEIPTSTPGRKWIALNGGKNYAELYTVIVKFNVPVDEYAGNYNIKINAIAVPVSHKPDEGFIAGMTQIREFNLNVYVDSDRIRPPENITMNVLEQQQNKSSSEEAVVKPYNETIRDKLNDIINKTSKIFYPTGKAVLPQANVTNILLIIILITSTVFIIKRLLD